MSEQATDLRKLAAEFIGTAFLVAVVVGSGIMAEALAGGNAAIALLGNTLATGAILVVLILIFGPISGAHFNPAVTIARTMTDSFSGIRPMDAPAFIVAQLVAAALAVGVWGWLLRSSQTANADG